MIGVIKIRGVGRNIEYRLNHFGIVTVEDIMKFTPEELHDKTHMDLKICERILIESKNVFNGEKFELVSIKDELKRNV